MLKRIKARLKKTQYSISVGKDGIVINTLLGFKEIHIKWEDIDLINAVQMFPGVPLKLEIMYRNSKCLSLFKNMPVWNETLKMFCERLPSFSMAAVEEASEDVYEQLHLCWKRDN